MGSLRVIPPQQMLGLFNCVLVYDLCISLSTQLHTRNRLVPSLFRLATRRNDRQRSTAHAVYAPVLALFDFLNAIACTLCVFLLHSCLSPKLRGRSSALLFRVLNFIILMRSARRKASAFTKTFSGSLGSRFRSPVTHLRQPGVIWTTV